jgi:hypothetical protein
MGLKSNLAAGLVALLASSALAATHPAPRARSPAPKTITVRIIGDDIQVPLPPGYCEVTGKYADYAQLAAATDNDNITVLQLDDCAEMAAGGRVQHFAVIKAIKKALAQRVPRDVFLHAMGAVPPSELSNAITDANLNKRVQDGIANVTSMNVQLETKIAPIASDDVAYYLGGLVKMQAADTAYQTSVVVALTSVKGHLIGYDFYAPGETARDLAALLAKTKGETRRLLGAN